MNARCLKCLGLIGHFPTSHAKSARTQPGEPVLARFEGWHQRRPPAVRFGSFVSFRVWSSVQPQNMATPYFGSFEDLGRQPTDFRPRGTRRSSCRRCCSCHPTRGMAERDPDRRPREAGQHMHILGVVSFVLPPGSCTLAIARN